MFLLARLLKFGLSGQPKNFPFFPGYVDFSDLSESEEESEEEEDEDEEYEYQGNDFSKYSSNKKEFDIEGI